MTPEVSELVGRAQEGDEDALAGLVALYQAPARRVAQNILGNSEDAEDAVQDAWVLALRSLDSLRDPTRCGGWFYRIVANVALRRRQRQAAQPAHLTLLEQAVQSPQERQGAANHLDLLPLAMHALSRKDHVVTSLHYFGGIPIATIARLLGIPQGTVKSRLYHAKQVMRKEILQMAKQPVARPEHIPDDFREVISGMHGEMPWKKIFRGDLSAWSVDQQSIAPGTIPDHWEIAGDDGLVGEAYAGGTRLAYGDATWQNVELSLLVTPLGGGNAQVWFRSDDSAHRFYMLDMLMGWQAIAVSRVAPDEAGNPQLVKLSVVNYPLEYQREYAVSIATRDHSITTYVDGALVNQVTDGSWLHGRIGLNVWYAKTLFRDIRVRLLE